jgi:hypothetical protein
VDIKNIQFVEFEFSKKFSTLNLKLFLFVQAYHSKDKNMHFDLDLKKFIP